jgi:hypothetical protein
MEFLKKGQAAAVNRLCPDFFSPEFVFVQKINQKRSQKKGKNKTKSS